MAGVLNELLRVCIQIDRLQGHCKTQEDRDRLTAWYEVRRKILNGGRAA